jgi:hypothetical protein
MDTKKQRQLSPVQEIKQNEQKYAKRRTIKLENLPGLGKVGPHTLRAFSFEELLALACRKTIVINYKSLVVIDRVKLESGCTQNTQEHTLSKNTTPHRSTAKRLERVGKTYLKSSD